MIRKRKEKNPSKKVRPSGGRPEWKKGTTIAQEGRKAA